MLLKLVTFPKAQAVQMANWIESAGGGLKMQEAKSALAGGRKGPRLPTSPSHDTDFNVSENPSGSYLSELRPPNFPKWLDHT